MAVDSVNLQTGSIAKTNQLLEDVKVQEKQTETKQLQNAENNKDLTRSPNASLNSAVSYSCQIAENGKVVIGGSLKSKDSKSITTPSDDLDTDLDTKEKSSFGEKETGALKGYAMSNLPSNYSSKLTGLSINSNLKDEKSTNMTNPINRISKRNTEHALERNKKAKTEKDVEAKDKNTNENKHINKNEETAKKIKSAEKARAERKKEEIKQKEIKAKEVKAKEVKEKKIEAKEAQRKKVLEKNRDLKNNQNQQVKNNAKLSSSSKKTNNLPSSKIELKEKKNRWTVVKTQKNQANILSNKTEYIKEAREEHSEKLGEKPNFFAFSNGSQKLEDFGIENDKKKSKLAAFFEELINWNKKADDFDSEQAYNYQQEKNVHKKAEQKAFNTASKLADKLNRQNKQYAV